MLKQRTTSVINVCRQFSNSTPLFAFYHQRNKKPVPPSRPQEKRRMEKAEFGAVLYKQASNNSNKPLPKILSTTSTDVNTIFTGDAHCPGCGAKLQTKDADREGYIREEAVQTHVEEKQIVDSVKKFLSTPAKQRKVTDAVDLKDLKIYERHKHQQKHLICHRCHGLTHYKHTDQSISLAKKIAADDYLTKLRELKDKKNIVIVKVVDMLNAEQSFITDFADCIGSEHPVILVGNKVDLMPKNAVYSRLTQWLREQWGKFLSHNQARMNLVSVVLVSASSGVNMIKLAERIEQFRDGKRDVYVVGSTNVGKSTLINRLMLVCGNTYETDFKNPRFADKLEPEKVGISTDQSFKEDAAEEEPTVEETPAKEEELKQKPVLTSSMMPGTTLKPVSFMFHNEHGKQSGFLFDTPGIWNKNLPANYLPPKDFEFLQPSKRIVPRHARLVPGKSLFIGGLGRIDYDANEVPREDWNLLILTFFGSHTIPMHVTKTSNADHFYQTHLGKLIYPPQSQDAPELLGSLEKKYTQVFNGTTRLKAFTDIVLSGVGWVAVTGVGKITLTVHAPPILQTFPRTNVLMPFETYKLKKEKMELDGKS